MITIFLKFSDREEALSVLSSQVGYQTSASEVGGTELNPVGFIGSTRYDLCFLRDASVSVSGTGDHVNLLWWGAPEIIPDFGSYVVTPMTPNCTFAS